MNTRTMAPRQLSQILIMLLAIALAMACSDASPSIDQSIGQRLINLDNRTGKTTQSLSAFVAYRFKDGAKNIQSLYVMNDNLQILWQIKAESLQSFEQYDRTWIGNASLALAPAEPVPNGKFRILLYDRAGHLAESEFSLPRLDTDPLARIPRAVRNQQVLTITPPASGERMTRELVVKDWTGTETDRFQVERNTVDLSLALPGRPAANYTLYLVDTWPDDGLILSSGPW